MSAARSKRTSLARPRRRFEVAMVTKAAQRRIVRRLSVGLENAHQQRENLRVNPNVDWRRKALSGSHLQQCDQMARPAGLEPATLGLEG